MKGMRANLGFPELGDDDYLQVSAEHGLVRRLSRQEIANGYAPSVVAALLLLAAAKSAAWYAPTCQSRDRIALSNFPA
jgi:hypothetical protein